MNGLTGLHRVGRWLVSPSLRWIVFSALLRCRLVRPEGAPDEPDAPVYLVGFFSRISGVASVARVFREHYETIGRRVTPIDLGATLSHGRPLPGSESYLTPAAVRSQRDRVGPGMILVIMDAAYSPLPLWLLGARFRRSKRLVALWFWELPEMPRSWRWSARCFDEIWTCSQFNFDAARGVTDRVSLVPLPVGTQIARARQFAEDRLRVLYLFNMSANFTRKNPLAVVEAFQKAFRGNPHAELVIKLTEGEVFPEGLACLRAAVAESTNMLLIEEPYSEEEVHRLLERSDVYLSLHRAEGMGQSLLEAIRQHLYVVATGWSGNVDFMRDRERCFLVPYKLVPVVDPQGNYPRGGHWAEPDVTAAAAILRCIAGSEKPGFVWKRGDGL